MGGMEAITSPPPLVCQYGAWYFFKINEKICWGVGATLQGSYFIDQRQYQQALQVCRIRKGAGVLTVCLSHWSLI